MNRCYVVNDTCTLKSYPGMVSLYLPNDEAVLFMSILDLDMKFTAGAMASPGVRIPFSAKLKPKPSCKGTPLWRFDTLVASVRYVAECWLGMAL